MSEHEQPLAGRRIGFIGGGNMAEALIAGLAAGHDAVEILVTEPSADRAALLAASYGARPVTVTELAARADVVVVAVKPQVVDEVLAELGSGLRPSQLVVSVAAGIPAARFESAAPGVPVVRVMPNTPALLGEGMSVLSAGAAATAEHLSQARAIIAATGRVLELPEEQLDAVTAVSGSGPAYFFYLAEALIDAGHAVGLDREVAAELVVQTALGAARMLRETGRAAAELRAAVTSPGGTTAAAIEAFESAGTRDTVGRAIRAARDRSVQLGRG